MQETTRTNEEEPRAESISCVKIRFVNKNELQTALCSWLIERVINGWKMISSSFL